MNFELGTSAPGTPYGRSKLAAEKYILSRKLEDGRRKLDKKVFILRPCMIHGPGNKGNLNLLYKVVSKGIPWPLGAYENRRSFTSIANLNFIVEQLLEKDIEPGIYNVADDAPLSTNRLIELIAESRGKKARIWKFSPKQVSRLARVCDKLQMLLTSERFTLLVL